MGMLAVAREQSTSLRPVCADAEQLPFRDNSFDLVFSNLAIQWCQQPEQLFAEIHRVLAPGGVCLLSTFIQGTLQELDNAWQQVDDAVHTNDFFNAQTLCEAAGVFADLGFWQETHTRYYGSVTGLMRELKAMGAHNLNDRRHRGLTGKSKLLKLARAYEPLRERDQLPARYVTLLMVLKKDS